MSNKNDRFLCLTIKEANGFSQADLAWAKRLGFEVFVSNYSGRYRLDEAARHMVEFLIDPVFLARKIDIPRSYCDDDCNSHDAHQVIFNTLSKSRAWEKERFARYRANVHERDIFDSIKNYLGIGTCAALSYDGVTLRIFFGDAGSISFFGIQGLANLLKTTAITVHFGDVEHTDACWSQIICSKIGSDAIAKLNELVPDDWRERFLHST
jgi:hypothetical protein